MIKIQFSPSVMCSGIGLGPLARHKCPQLLSRLDNLLFYFEVILEHNHINDFKVSSSCRLSDWLAHHLLTLGCSDSPHLHFYVYKMQFMLMPDQWRSFYFVETETLHSPGYPGIHYAYQTSLGLIEIPVSASPVLGLKVYTITSSFNRVLARKWGAVCLQGFSHGKAIT